MNGDVAITQIEWFYPPLIVSAVTFLQAYFTASLEQFDCTQKSVALKERHAFS